MLVYWIYVNQLLALLTLFCVKFTNSGKMVASFQNEYIQNQYQYYTLLGGIGKPNVLRRVDSTVILRMLYCTLEQGHIQYKGSSTTFKVLNSFRFCNEYFLFTSCSWLCSCLLIKLNNLKFAHFFHGRALSNIERPRLGHLFCSIL